jgi:hypothetical protein
MLSSAAIEDQETGEFREFGSMGTYFCTSSQSFNPFVLGPWFLWHHPLSRQRSYRKQVRSPLMLGGDGVMLVGL